MGYGYGFSGALIVVGLILALAVQINVQGLDIPTIGWILTLVGIVLLILTVVQNTRNSNPPPPQQYRDPNRRP